MAEEDVIFGKNRHLFGGIEPSRMKLLSVTAKRTFDTGDPTVVLKFELPEDTVIDGQTICTVAGAIIRKSTEGYPQTEFEGEFVVDVKENGSFVDEAVVYGNTYYYAAFPYSDQEVYLRGDSGRASISVTGNIPTYIFGYDLDLADSDPATRVSYPEDVHNHGYESAKMDFSVGVFDYGDWMEQGCFMPKPCMLNADGTVYEYIDPNDYSKTVNGEESQVANTAFEGNAMMEWPKIYTKRWSENGIYYFRCSDVKMDDTWDCWCNYDVNDAEIDHFYTAIYMGSAQSSVLRSLSGPNYTRGITYANSITYATNNGSDWYIDVLADRLLIQDLLVLISKNTDTQAVFGKGPYFNSGDDYIACGVCDTKGLFWGSNSLMQPVKIFGMENWWGDGTGVPYSRWLAGIFNTGKTGGSSGAYYTATCIKLTLGTHDGSTVRGYITSLSSGTGGYKECISASYTSTSTEVNKLGYPTAWSILDQGRLFAGPTSLNGSATTYDADKVAYTRNLTSISYRAVACGNDGAFGMILNNIGIGGTGTNYGACGASLSCKPRNK